MNLDNTSIDRKNIKSVFYYENNKIKEVLAKK